MSSPCARRRARDDGKPEPDDDLTPAEEKLLDFVLSDLYADDIRDQGYTDIVPPQHAYQFAKQSARRGDLGPLRKFLTSMLRDPEIADFIAVPKGPRVRRDRSRPFKELVEHHAAETIKRVRKIAILQRETLGMAPPDRVLIYKIAAKVLKRKPAEIRAIVHRGSSPKKRSVATRRKSD
jgi:hypothetical protein